jgi:hypothetical protein
MKSVIEKLAEIEATAQAIVEHAEVRKHDVEMEVMQMRREFDEKLAKETDEKLQKIRAEREANLNLKMEEERKKNERFIEQLKNEFSENHTAYAKEILKNILEV